MTSMSYQYLIGLTTVCNIIRETCEVIWNTLCPLVLPPSLSEEDWLQIANDFEDISDFIHCIGAIDGKHITIQVRIFIIIKSDTVSAVIDKL